MAARTRGLSAFSKTIVRDIRGSLGRFVAIMGIVALGCGFYAGLQMSGPIMRLEADEFYDGTNLYDIRIVGTLGFEDKDVARVAKIEGVQAVMPSKTCDVTARLASDQIAMRVSSLDVDAAEKSTQISSTVVASNNDSYLNRAILREGTWPKGPDECVISADDKGYGVGVGDTIEIVATGKASTNNKSNDSENSDSTDNNKESLRERTLKIVGKVSSSTYPYNGNYGSTTLGSGSIGMYAFVSDAAFKEDLPYTEIYVRVNGADAKQSGSNAYNALVSEVEDRIEERKGELAHARLEALRSEAQTKLDDARAEFKQKEADAKKELDDAKAKLDDAKAELARGERKLADGQREYNEGAAELEDSRAQLDNSQGTLDSSRAQLNDARAQLQAGQKSWQDGVRDLMGKLGMDPATPLSDAKAQLQAQRKELEEGKAQLEAGITQAAEGIAQAQAGIAELEEGIAKLDAQIAMLPEGEQKSALIAQRDALAAQLSTAQAGLQQAQATKESLEQQLASLPSVESIDQALAGIDQLESSRATLDQNEQKVAAGERELADGERQHAWGKQQLEQGESELASAANELASGRADLASGRAEYEEGLAKYEEARAEADQKLSDARKKLEDAQKDIDELELPDIYLLDRSKNEGVTVQNDDSKRIDSIANVFPLLFFLVAALIALTTMTRMVGDDRIQIGTYKALGYTKGRIASKYLWYAGLAGIVGAAVGIAILSQLLPFVVTSAYSVIYVIPLRAFPLPVDARIALMAGGLGVGVTLVATYVAVLASLREVPATLMLPRAPVAGKRIFLENITFVWKRLSFLWKVTCRNLFRYKRRLAMTVVGISGCTALLLVGFGLHDAIWDIIDNQYGPIVHYDTTIRLDSDATESQVDDVTKYLESTGEVHNVVHVRQENMQMGFAASSLVPMHVQVVIPQSEQSMAKAITFANRITKEPISMDDDAVIITEKLSLKYGVKVGDEVLLYDQDDIGTAIGEGHPLKVTGISENYVGNIVYVGRNAWASVAKSKAENTPLVFSTIYASTTNNAEIRKQIANTLHERGDVNTVVFSDETIQTYRNLLSVVDMVVVLLIVSAGLLAFIVLYNLTNINIDERVREIASLKVLGFTKMEVYTYIFREILLLALMGDILGLVLGTYLETFVVTTAEVDYVMFGRTIHPMSYVYSFALTVGFTLLILLIMRRKLDQVNMVESLKSVE